MGPIPDVTNEILLFNKIPNDLCAHYNVSSAMKFWLKREPFPSAHGNAVFPHYHSSLIISVEIWKEKQFNAMLWITMWGQNPQAFHDRIWGRAVGYYVMTRNEDGGPNVIRITTRHHETNKKESLCCIQGGSPRGLCPHKFINANWYPHESLLISADGRGTERF